MKIVIAVLVLIAISISIDAQTLVKENKLWSCTMEGCDGPLFYRSNFIKFFGDTIVNEKLYKKVWTCDDSLQSNWELESFIREDISKKIYLINNRTSEEMLIYDFNLELGDSILTPYSDDHYYFVHEIEYVKLYIDSEDTIKKISIYSGRDPNDGYKVADWYEEVGSSSGILFGANAFEIVGGTNILTCYFEDDILKYHNDRYLTCFPYGWPNALLSIEKDQLIIQPYISENNLVFNFQNIHQDNSIVQVFNCLGSLVYEKRTIKNNSLKIPIQSFNNGIYIYRYTVNDKIYSGKVAIEK